jgi:large conductance mechanosensitive channel
MSMASEFRDFALRGNVVDLAVGVIIGGAFGKLVGALVDKVMMPPLGLLLGGIDFADQKLVLAQAVIEADQVIRPEVAIGYGEFINAVIQFLIIAWALFLVIKAMNRIKKKEEAAPAAPPETPEDIVLLREIRDLLRK